MNSPKAQAEAMARELLHSRIHSNTKFEDTLSTALEKLLTENEGLKEGLRNQERVTEVCNEAYLDKIKPIRHLWDEFNQPPGVGMIVDKLQELQSQLTATEAKLEIGRKWMRHDDGCMAPYGFGQISSGKFIAYECTCGLDAFLSTLTAAKKESE